MIVSILDSAEPFYAEDGRTVFDPSTLSKLRSSSSDRELLGIALDDQAPLARRFAAVEALRQLEWTAWTKDASASAAVAKLLAKAITSDEIHNRWGLPGFFVGPTGELMLSLADGVDDALRSILDDDSPLMIVGSQEATTNAMNKFRVSDLAAFLLAKHLGRPWHPAETPAERDAKNAGLR